jgi:hypothetical protein
MFKLSLVSSRFPLVSKWHLFGSFLSNRWLSFLKQLHPQICFEIFSVHVMWVSRMNTYFNVKLQHGVLVQEVVWLVECLLQYWELGAAVDSHVTLTPTYNLQIVICVDWWSGSHAAESLMQEACVIIHWMAECYWACSHLISLYKTAAIRTLTDLCCPIEFNARIKI